MSRNESGDMNSIIYSLISIGDVVLIEHAIKEGNFVTLANRMLSKLPQDDHRKSYKDKTEKFIFHCMVQDGLTYLCFATIEHKTTVCYGFLEEIRKRFTSMFDKNQMLNARAYDPRYAGFSRTLEIEMEKFGQITHVDERFEVIHTKIEKTKEVMIDNINKAIKRGDDIDSLLEKADIMVGDSEQFKVTAKKVKAKMWWKLVGVWVIGGILLIIIIWLIFSIACGFDFSCLD
eukprot:TRINITY_DN869_c4_g1_i2.p1 TRINITY_DN869_c4_g1~~TRINITY_DN869_c4_g1_i2.p1  ORF type:complete len:232 (-),score=41.00 TRINITY_DN869_c4_g1_i2:58-753(-)